MMIFGVVLSRHMQNNNRHFVYNGWEEVLLYSRDVHGGN